MPRTARLDVPGLLQHVIVRGINRQPIFRDERDREGFCRRLSKLLLETETECLAWALIPNHFHLLLRPTRTTLAALMRRLLTGYAVVFNLRHQRSGRLFQNRYKSIVCEEEPYLLELVRYVHLNPLRAGLVTDLEELERFPWAGHRVLLGGGTLQGQVTDEVLARFGRRVEDARARYREFVAGGVSHGHREELVGGGLRRRLALQGRTPERESYDERVLGSGAFVDRLWQEEELRGRLGPGLTLPELLDRVAAAFAVPRDRLTRRSKDPAANEARRVACHVAVAELGAKGGEIGALLGVGPSAVCHAAARGRERWAADPRLRQAVLAPPGGGAAEIKNA